MKGAAHTLVAERLAGAVGAAHVAVADGRIVTRPGAPAEVADVLRIAGDAGLGLGVDAKSGVALDLGRMSQVLHLDETSLLVEAQAGLTADALEALLGERGLHLPPLPWHARARTLGALVAAPRPSEASPRLGRFTAACVAVHGLLADGTEVATRAAPRKATGPDLMHALVGARGTLGLITAVTLRIERRQELRREAAWRLPSLPEAVAALTALLVAGGRPHDLSVARDGDGVSVWLRWDGPEPLVAAEEALAARLLAAAAGTSAAAAPPPRERARPHERALDLGRLAAVAADPGAHDLGSGDGVRLAGWHVGGAAWIDPGRAPTTPPPSPLTAALKRCLDPDGRFPAWPGA